MGHGEPPASADLNQRERQRKQTATPHGQRDHAATSRPARRTQVILFLCCVLYVPVLETKYTHFRVNVYYVISLGWFLWLCAYILRAKLTYILWMLT